MENKKVFREKTLERISSPEHLNDYMRVTSPGVWLMLGAIIVLLVGVCVWGVFGHMDTVVKGAAAITDEQAVCYVKEASASAITMNTALTIDGHAARIVGIGKAPIQLTEEGSEYLLHLGGFSADDRVIALRIETDAPAGEYAVSLVTNSVSPMSFILN